MPPPYIFREVAFDWFTGPLRVQKQKPSTTVLEFFDELVFGPELDIIDEQNNMHSSFAGLYEFE